MRKTIFFVALVSLLVFPNLGSRVLWQDEAETALVARQMVRSNVWLPYAFDDQGPISQDWKYQFSVSPLWRWHPWLQFYVTALSFKLFGISSFTARMSFALIGISCYAYFLYFLKKHGPKGQLFFFVASLLLLFSAPFLLHIRQDRYYALSVLFTLITVDGYLSILVRTVLPTERLSFKHAFKYIFGSIFLFHSFLPGALALQIAFWIHQFGRLLRPGLAAQQGRAFKRFSFAFLIALLFTLPWAIWMKIGGQNINFSAELMKQHLWQHYIYVHKFIFPLFLLIPLLSHKLRKIFFADEKLCLFLLIIITNLSLYTVNHPYFFRYLVPLIPLFIYIAAWIFSHSNKLLQWIFVLAVLQMTLRTLPGYFYEITHSYFGANEQLVQFLNSLNTNRYKNLAVNYDNFTFRFHMHFRVTGPQELLSYSACPDIIIVYPNWGNEDLLRNRAQVCGLHERKAFLYEKLADDPDPTNHKFTTKQLTHTLEVFLLPLSPN